MKEQVKEEIHPNIKSNVIPTKSQYLLPQIGPYFNENEGVKNPKEIEKMLDNLRVQFRSV